MKTEIIPTILVKSFDEVKERIKAVEKYVNWVQLDIMDGIFVDNKTWPYTEGKISDLEELKTKVHPVKSSKGGIAKQSFNRVKLEAHLMIEKPEEVIDDWLGVVERIIVHHESKISSIKELIKKVHNQGKGIGLAINPETPIETVKPFLNDLPCTIKNSIQAKSQRDEIMVQGLDLVLCMTVQPGWGGQEFRDEVLVKIKSLREIWPNGNIEVDGGVDDENIKKITGAGANLICVGTFIFKSKNIKKAIEDLKNI